MSGRKRGLALLLTALLVLACCGCGDRKPEQPIRLTLWHVYGGQTDSPLNTLIDRFNETVGKEQGIYVQVTSVSNSSVIHEMVLASANGDPGAAELPDLFSSYPKTVLALPDDSILVDHRDYFSREELSRYIPAFLEEGTVNDRLVVFPVAKSTDILFVNRTAFDRFAAETGAEIGDLKTWEGLYKTAEDYALWTDGRTPDVPGDARAFFVHDNHMNYFQVGTESLGEPFFAGGKPAFGPAFEAAWEPYARAAIQGGVWLRSGYATEPLRTGEAVASVASSASVLYYSDTVTYPDNTDEKAEFQALPCPTFADGGKMVMQRGVGFCVTRSTPEREKAAEVFLKWLTEPKLNVEFVTQLGYMPVTREAFTDELPGAIGRLSDPKYKSLYEAFRETQQDYSFYTPPQLATYLDTETAFEYGTRLQLSAARRQFLKREESGDREELLQELSRTGRAELEKIFD